LNPVEPMKDEHSPLKINDKINKGEYCKLVGKRYIHGMCLAMQLIGLLFLI